MKKKNGVKVYNNKEKSHVRDFWLEEVRHSHMTYVSENRKKRLPRRQKYKDKFI